MCEALRDLMKEEIQKENQKAVDIAAIAIIKSAMNTFGLDTSKAMESLSIPEADQIRYASKF